MKGIETTAVLRVRGNDAKHDAGSIAYHIRECERIQARGLNLDICYKYPSSNKCHQIETESIGLTKEDDCHDQGMKSFQRKVEEMLKREAIEAKSLKAKRLQAKEGRLELATAQTNSTSASTP